MKDERDLKNKKLKTLTVLGYEDYFSSLIPQKDIKLTIEYNKRMPDSERLIAP